MTEDISSTWFYATEVNGQWNRSGPVSKLEIARLISIGSIDAHSLVWEPAYATWVTAKNAGFSMPLVPPPLPELNATQVFKADASSAPPPLPEKQHIPYADRTEERRENSRDDEYPSTPAAAHPWRRFFARAFDYQVLGMPLAFLTFFTVGFVVPSSVKFLSTMNPALDLALTLVVITLTMPFLEAALLSGFGATPGKAIFAIKVRTLRGEKLSFEQALRRSFNVTIYGLGMGIPIIALFTQMSAYWELKDSGKTSWDKKFDLQVFHKRWGGDRWIVVVFAFILMLMLRVLYQAIAQS